MSHNMPLERTAAVLAAIVRRGESVAMRQEDADPREIWSDIVADLERARLTLPADASDHRAVVEYRYYIEHYKLELACDQLEAYSEHNAVTREFWLASATPQ